MNLTLPKVKKIVVLRANALGDFFFAYPALYSLRDTYPESEIVYLGNPWHKEFLENRLSPVNRVVVVPPSKGVREEPNAVYISDNLTSFFEEMKKEKFDIAIQMHGGGRNSNAFILNLGAKLTVGLRTPDAPFLDRWVPYDLYQNEFAKYLEVVKCVGTSVASIHPFLSVTQADIIHAQQYISKNKRFIVIHPGASDSRRRWPEKNFALIADTLAKEGYAIVITGTNSEKKIIKKIISLMEHKAINLCGTLTLSGLTGIMALAHLVISNDTGPLHLADAIGTKTVGIYWFGNAITSSPLIRTNHKVLISWTIFCPECGKNCMQEICHHSVSFVEEVKPAPVIQAAEELLSTPY